MSSSSLPSAWGITVLTLAFAVLLAITLVRVSGDASITIEAATESITATNSCPDMPLDLTLPPGTLRIVSASEERQSGEPHIHVNPIAVRVTGHYTLRIRRHAGGPLEVSFNAASPDTTSSNTGWKFSVAELCPNSCRQPNRHESEALESVQYTGLMPGVGTADARTLEPVSIPLWGAVQFGEHLSPGDGIAESRVPHYPLLHGAIKIRVREWLNETGRIELDQIPLDLGDVLLTHPEWRAHSSESNQETSKETPNMCVARLAQGFVRADAGSSDEQALRAVVRVDRDSVLLDRGVDGVQIGPSLIDKVVAQPVVTLAWQSAVVLFGLFGFVVGIHELIGVIRGHRDTSSPAGSRFFHRFRARKK